MVSQTLETHSTLRLPRIENTVRPTLIRQHDGQVWHQANRDAFLLHKVDIGNYIEWVVQSSALHGPFHHCDPLTAYDGEYTKASENTEASSNTVTCQENTTRSRQTGSFIDRGVHRGENARLNGWAAYSGTHPASVAKTNICKRHHHTPQIIGPPYLTPSSRRTRRAYTMSESAEPPALQLNVTRFPVWCFKYCSPFLPLVYFPKWYLLAIGLVAGCSFGWSLPLSLGCNPK